MTDLMWDLRYQEEGLLEATGWKLVKNRRDTWVHRTHGTHRRRHAMKIMLIRYLMLTKKKE